jgi:cytochrome c oxidase subunit 2
MIVSIFDGVNMVDSTVVLYGQTIAYSLYCIVIMLLVGWFGIAVTRKGKGDNIIKPGIFYTFVAFLAILGVSLHLITYNTIPWTPIDLNRGNYKPDQVVKISVKEHKFILPEEQIRIKKNTLVKFDVRSSDLTYGFGLFRPDNSMIFQMQVIPWHMNDILWVFQETGKFTIRSTEYSGPKGAMMVVKDAVEIYE